jgi:hypothetical protein
VPVALTKVNLTGTLIDGEGRPLCGTLTFSPSAPLADTTDALLVRQFGCGVTLSEEGAFSVELLSTDNANLSPPGWCWMVKECFPGVPANLWAFFLAYGTGSTQDISTLEPVAVAPATGMYLPLYGGTVTGPVVLPGNPAAALGAAPKQYVDAETSRAESAEATLAAEVAGAQLLLAQTAVKTANYQAAANQVVPVSTTSNAVTVTLPNVPAAGTLAAVKQIATSGSFTTTVQCSPSGSDVINKGGGATSLTLSLLNQGVLLEYGSGIWVILSDDLPLAGLDGRYVLQSSLPLAIGSGGTGQPTALAAFDALSPMTTYGDLVYEGNSGTALRLAGSTSATRRFLTQTGTGTVSAAPGWGQIAASDLAASPAQGEAVIVGSGSALSYSGIFGTRPEWFGTVSGVSGDDTAILAAIAAVKAGAAGCPGPVVISQPSAVNGTVTAQPGVNIYCTGQGNRQGGIPDVFAGGYIMPSSTFPATGVPLVTVGASGTPTANPCGLRLDGLCLSGLTPGSVNIANCIGVLVTDTADVRIISGYLANFDRPGSTGCCIKLSSATAGNGVGFSMSGDTVLSSSYQGIYGDGAGVSDLRVIGNLFHSCTQQFTLGPTAGGGGLQASGNHYTYSGMPSGGYHLSLGSQAGDFMITNDYFDQAGNTVCVQLATAKGKFSGNHFLAAASSTAASLVKVSTSSQELNCCDNDCNGNGSSITALLQTTAHSGSPTGGIWVGNSVYGTASSLVAVLIDSAGSAIADYTTAGAGPYVAGNRQFA